MELIHISHYAPVLKGLQLIQCVRTNPSAKSHEELNESETLDEGNIEEFGLYNGRLSTIVLGFGSWQVVVEPPNITWKLQ